MTTHVVPDGMKRKPTAEEWETLLESRIPELIRRAKVGNYNPEALLSTLQNVIEGKMIGDIPTGKANILRLISGGKQITIRATSGQRTIAQATDIFTWGIDSDFKNWGLDVPGEAKPETPVLVYEMVEDGDFETIFDSLLGREREDLCLTQEQIIAFAKDHKDWLRKEGYATFFLFKENRKFFVALVLLSSAGEPNADVNHFSGVHVWNGDRRPRLVVPQTLVA